jgi:hypothetical protein
VVLIKRETALAESVRVMQKLHKTHRRDAISAFRYFVFVSDAYV